MSNETCKKLIKLAEKMRVFIITRSSGESWDIKAELWDYALSIDKGAERTSDAVKIKGYSPIYIYDYCSVNQSRISLDGGVFVTYEWIAHEIKVPPGSAKICKLPKS